MFSLHPAARDVLVIDGISMEIVRVRISATGEAKATTMC